MYRFLFVFINVILFSTFCFATPLITIDSKNTNLSSFELEYFVDDTEKMLFEDIKKEKFTKIKSKVSLGQNRVDTWLRFNVVNRTDKHQTLFIHNELAYLSNEIIFIEVQNHTILNRVDISLLNKKNNDKMYGTDAIFPISLEGNQSKTIYIKNKILDYQFFHISIHDAKSSKDRLRTKHTLPLLVLGILLALILYHFMLYIATQYKEYLYYLFYLISAFMWELQLTGTLANIFNFYYNGYNDYFLLFVFLVPIFLILFTKKVFNTKNMYKTENLILNSIFLLFGTGVIIGLYNITMALNIVSYMYMYMFFMLFLTTISIYKKKNPLALIFLIGNSFFLFFSFINDLFFLGMLPYNLFTFNAALLGLLVESLVLAFIIAYRIKLLQKSEIEKVKILVQKEELSKLNETLQSKINEAVEEVKSKEKLLRHQSRLAQMGEVINMIAHQWRQPLGAVSAVVIGIESKIVLNKFNLEEAKDRENFMKYLNNKLLSIHEYVAVMTETVDNFRNFFKKQDNIENMNINKVVDKALHIVETSFEQRDISITQKMISKKSIPIFDNEVLQVLLNILQNSDDAFRDNDIKYKEIMIHTYDTDREVVVTLCDNAGGIPHTILEKIFDPYFSTKTEKNGTGIGLYMSKMIMEDHHKGTLIVKNKGNGVCFMLVFPYGKELLNGL